MSERLLESAGSLTIGFIRMSLYLLSDEYLLYTFKIQKESSPQIEWAILQMNTLGLRVWPENLTHCMIWARGVS